MGRPSIFSCFREKVAKGSELEKKGPGQKSSKSKSSLAKEWVLRKTVLHPHWQGGKDAVIVLEQDKVTDIKEKVKGEVTVELTWSSTGSSLYLGAGKGPSSV